jgi:hypothetical protein
MLGGGKRSFRADGIAGGKDHRRKGLDMVENRLKTEGLERRDVEEERS